MAHNYRTIHSHWDSMHDEFKHEQQECSCGSILVRVASRPKRTSFRAPKPNPFAAPEPIPWQWSEVAYFKRLSAYVCDELRQEKEHT